MTLAEYLELRIYQATTILVERDGRQVEEKHEINPAHLAFFIEVWQRQYTEAMQADRATIKREKIQQGLETRYKNQGERRLK